MARYAWLAVCSPTYFRWPAAQQWLAWYAQHCLRLRRVELLPNKTAIFRSFLPAMSYFHELQQSCPQDSPNSQLAGLVLERSNVLTVGGAKLHSLLSAHHLIGAYFLTTESDKRMRLLTRLYGICFIDLQVRLLSEGSYYLGCGFYSNKYGNYEVIPCSEVSSLPILKSLHLRDLNLEKQTKKVSLFWFPDMQ